jgi:FdhE protein
MLDCSVLRAGWNDLLARRSSLSESLALWTAVIDVWARWTPGEIPVLRWSADECRGLWDRGLPLLSDAPLSVPPQEVEELIGPLIEILAGADEVEALSRFAEAWDQGEVTLSMLLPVAGKEATSSLQERTGLSSDLLGFITSGSLRPLLEIYFVDVRSHLTEGVWDRGACPFCGGAPSFADLLEDGQRRLACHLCGGAWTFARLMCPFCENWSAKDLVRLMGEEQEEGYFIEACLVCRGYVKGIDRRLRWNAGSALVEDWGSPHLDLIARRQEFWRAGPSLIQLAKPDE